MRINKGRVFYLKWCPALFKYNSRKYTTAVIHTSLPHDGQKECLNYEELKKVSQYINKTGFEKFCTIHESSSERVEPFRFSGISLSSLLSHTSTTLSQITHQYKGTLKDIKNFSDSKFISYYKIRNEQNISYKLIAGQLQNALKNPNDKVLINLLKYYLGVVPQLSKELDKTDISLIIRRLVTYQISILKRFTIEQSNYSRLINDFDISSLLKYKGQSFSSVRRIILTFVHNFHLTVYDYELILLFFMKNLRYFDAMKVFADLETRIREGEYLHLTNYLWSVKFQLLCNSEIQTWKLQRYRLKKNRAQSIPEDYIYPYCKMINGKPDMRTLLLDLQKDELALNGGICQSIILSMGKLGKTNMLEEFIKYMWKIGPTDEKLAHKNKLAKNSQLFPTFDLLRCIMLAYTNNSQTERAISTCNKFIECYSMDFSKSQIYIETVLECVGLLSQNALRDLQTRLWKIRVQPKEYERAIIPLGQSVFDTIWKQCDVVPKTGKMYKICLLFASLQTLLDCLPTLYNRAANFKSGATNAEAAYAEDLLMSFLNKCRIRLCQNREFYQAEQVINLFSINEHMKKTLLQKIEQYQQRYLNRLGKSVSTRKQQLIDDDDDETFGLW